jgi:hypothetical protein
MSWQVLLEAPVARVVDVRQSIDQTKADKPNNFDFTVQS